MISNINEIVNFLTILSDYTLTNSAKNYSVTPFSENRVAQEANMEGNKMFTEEQVVEFIGGKSRREVIKITAGLDPIRIKSPKDFKQSTLDVHGKGDDWLWVEEKLERAVKEGSNFGWEELIFCYENYRDIHPEWWSRPPETRGEIYSHAQFFAEALCEIGGVRHVGMLCPNEDWCNVYYVGFEKKSFWNHRFPVIKEERQ